MHSRAVVLLVACAVHAVARDKSGKRVGTLADDVVEKLFSRALAVSPTAQKPAALDTISYGKPAVTSHCTRRTGTFLPKASRRPAPQGRSLHVQASRSERWQPLPHVELDRRALLRTGTAPAAAWLAASSDAVASAASGLSSRRPRSLISIDKPLAIPVWPSWAGGRVVPVSLGNAFSDPFLLLAHHKHWFDPRDPLRGPFKKFGEVTGLPYIDKEGFSMHPHRGFDILTYVLDGSDGFRHRDSLGGSRTYRGGTAQWMRCGSGVLHEEFWETREDRRTNIELFQIWINLPGRRKLDEPAIHYIGEGTDQPWKETVISDGVGSAHVMVRDIGATLDSATFGSGSNNVATRPPVNIQHIRVDPGAQWTANLPPGHSALLYVREGTACLPGTALLDSGASAAQGDQFVDALQVATFAPDSDFIVIRNAKRAKGDILDALFLTGSPLREPVASGGPVVMNTQQEVDDAYRQLRDGSFLNREDVLRQQAWSSSIRG